MQVELPEGTHSLAEPRLTPIEVSPLIQELDVAAYDFTRREAIQEGLVEIELREQRNATNVCVGRTTSNVMASAQRGCAAQFSPKTVGNLTWLEMGDGAQV